MNNKQVLLYGLAGQEQEISEILDRNGVMARWIQAEDLDQTLGHLCGLKGYDRKKKQEAGDPLTCGVMVFHNLEDDLLHGILGELRQKNLGTGSLKAVVTPTNQNWTFRALLGEIQNEQQVMAALIRLKKLRSQIVELDFTNVKLMRAVMQAEKLMSGTEEVTVEEIDKAYQALEEVIHS